MVLLSYFLCICVKPFIFCFWLTTSNFPLFLAELTFSDLRWTISSSWSAFKTEPVCFLSMLPWFSFFALLKLLRIWKLLFAYLWKLSIVLNLLGGARDFDATPAMLATRLLLICFWSFDYLKLLFIEGLLSGLTFYPTETSVFCYPYSLFFSSLPFLKFLELFIYGNSEKIIESFSLVVTKWLLWLRAALACFKRPSFAYEFFHFFVRSFDPPRLVASFWPKFVDDGALCYTSPISDVPSLYYFIDFRRVSYALLIY